MDDLCRIFANSSRILWIDLETNGLPTGCRTWEYPRVQQICAIVTEGLNPTPLRVLNKIITPEGWTPDPETQQFHGITNERIAAEGIPIRHALIELADIAKECNLIVAHNAEFELKCIINEYEKSRLKSQNPFYQIPHIDTMFCLATTISGPSVKWPRLNEVYRATLGKDIENAHDAYQDCKAMIDIFTTYYNNANGAEGGGGAALK